MDNYACVYIYIYVKYIYIYIYSKYRMTTRSPHPTPYIRDIQGLPRSSPQLPSWASSARSDLPRLRKVPGFFAPRIQWGWKKKGQCKWHGIS